MRQSQLARVLAFLLLASPSLGWAEPACPIEALLRSRAFDMRELEPKPQKVSGVNLPRDERPLYRGARMNNPQFSLALAVRAMLGDPTAVVGSYLFSEIRAILMGQKSIADSDLHTQLQEVNLSARIQLLLECNPSRNEADATRLAQALVDYRFGALKAKGFVESRFLDESSKYFEDFPKDAIYSTVYSALATVFGGQVLELQNAVAARAVDKHFWQYANKGVRFDQHPDGDAGEFLTAGYIPAEAIQGYWLRPDRSLFDEGNGAFDTLYQQGLNWAFEKIHLGGTTAIAVIPLRGHKCIERQGDRFFACESHFGHLKSELKPYPSHAPQQEPLPISGFILACNQREACAPPASWPLAYKAASLRLEAEQVAAIAKISLPNQVVRYFDVSIGPKPIRVKDLSWSKGGPIPGQHCVLIDEPGDTQFGHENFICSKAELGLQWSYQGPIPGLHCVQINEESDPQYWWDNYLCSLQDEGLQWSQRGAYEGMDCINVDQPADPHNWHDNFLCGPRH